MKRRWRSLLALASLVGPLLACTTEEGPIPTAPPQGTCQGTARSCGDLGGAECTTQQGCRSNGLCTGERTPCGTYTTPATCEAQSCSWSVNLKTCLQGTGSACDVIVVQSVCQTADGCSWQERCEGTPRSCAEVEARDCTKQVGCRLDQGPPVANPDAA